MKFLPNHDQFIFTVLEIGTKIIFIIVYFLTCDKMILMMILVNKKPERDFTRLSYIELSKC